VDIGILLIIVFILAPLLERLLKLGRPKEPPQEGGAPQRAPRTRRPRDLPDEAEDRPFRSIPSADAEPDMTSAADMLPDDLWEILTGERRQPRPPPEPTRSQTGIETAPAGTRTGLDPWRAGSGTGVEPRRGPADGQSGPAAPAPASRTADRRRDEAAARQRAEPRTLPERGRRPPTPPRERRLPEVTMRRDPADTGIRRPPARTPTSPPDDYIREIPLRAPSAAVSQAAPSLDPEVRRARFEARRALMPDAPMVLRPERSTEYAFRGFADVRRALVMAEILGRPRGLED
jgi:hypothetical protein